ncbi:MAG: HPP family protein [Candidatus Cloacimonetes bacterium]|nr:HPP family protein [Candidatus Cloacimonadota bacterium]
MKITLPERLTEFKRHWKSYVVQSSMAFATLFVVLILLGEGRLANVASLGASAFIVFAMPTEITGQTRNLVGGQFIGMFIGALIGLAPIESHALGVVMTALAVGLTMFVMVVVDMEHPPACGTALGMAVYGWEWRALGTIAAAVVLLAVIHRVFKPYLRDLV